MKSFVFIESIFQKWNLILEVCLLKEPLIMLTQNLVFLWILHEEVLNFFGICIVGILKHFAFWLFFFQFGFWIFKLWTHFGSVSFHFFVFCLEMGASFFESFQLFLHVFFLHFIQNFLLFIIGSDCTYFIFHFFHLTLAYFFYFSLHLL